MRFSPETFPYIEAHEPAASNAIGTTCDAVNVAYADGVWIVVHEDYAVDANQLTLVVNYGTTSALAIAGATTISSSFGGWKNITAQTSDAITALTAAASHTLDGETAGNNCLWWFYIPAAIIPSGYNWIQADFAATGDAGNIASVVYILDGARYKSQAPPTVVA